ncbi:rho GTPase-activating protein 45 [Latimeria chalumnae]|uniref:rho GTPase-activating protein 45 n=1 Tax=Latimeria chalumnae TaxID=7897 RepID=UPI0006D8DD56|nr:PREDICTED: minor histocompatibility protein HA-1 isoform X2 [Latimeria chalumnae]|eukprot:XP_014344039.1 PREDICTED: minor histocompatibility protein HA-1 isoform X2 [Latimeria chalumnae]
MFSRKKKELMKTPSISKRVRAGSPIPQNSSELTRKEAVEVPTSQSSNLTEPLAGSVSVAKLSSSPSQVNTIKRPTSLSRHASAAGFTLSVHGSWGFSKGHKNAMCYSPSEAFEGAPVIEVEDISQLLHDVARFAEAVEKLKDVVLGDENQESRRRLAHECLGEVLRILRQVINKYPLLNTVETLTAAGTLISKVKGFHYESSNEADKKEFEKAIETMAVAFSSNVSELLMGEVDSSTLLSLPPTDKSRSMENLYGGIPGQGLDIAQMKNDFIDSGSIIAEEVDIMLQRYEGGVESALQYAKIISKYMKDLIYYLEKRTTLEMEFAKGLQKLAHTCKPILTQEHYMPFFSIYGLALEQDVEYGHGVVQMASTLQNQTFLQPLSVRRQEHEKRRKEIKEQWHRAQKKLQDAEANLRKAKQAYMQRCEEHEKAKYTTVKAEEDQQNTSSNATKSLDKKRKLAEEARNKAEEAEATYRVCIADAKTQKQELEDVKVNVLRQIQEVIKQSDQIVKSATVSYYQIMHMQTAPLPVHFQTLCESSKLYDPGQQYASFVKGLQKEDESESHYDFEPSPSARSRVPSFNTQDAAASSGSEAQGEETGNDEGSNVQKEHRSSGVFVEKRGGRGHQVHKSWPTTVSDADSVGGSSSLDSPSANLGEFARKLPRTPSSGTMSSNEELDEKGGNEVSFEQSINGIAPEITVPTGPFRNVGLSKAAQTHRLRKLRTPSKCRECDSYVYFQGAECEECYLACHKKCLETLAIQCGHKKLQGKLQLFGRDFTQASQDCPNGIPFIIKKCISEIEKRALKMKGIYRVNGVKTRVEKLCQAFENGKELVELSQASPHDISNVLKLYLRQIPEPLMPFRLYNDLMGLAKESLQGGPEGEAGKGPELVDKGPQTDKEIVIIVTKLKELLKELPDANMATLQFIVKHLKRISELEQDNKMTPSNLGIVFGPTLMRPRPTEATVSLSSLVDYPHQARIIETMIVFYAVIFESAELVLNSDEETLDQGQPLSSSYSEYQDEAADGQYDRDRLYSDDKPDALCANSLDSSESRERSIDSDFELEDGVSEGGGTGQVLSEEITETQKGYLLKQESETSTEETNICDDNEGQISRTSSIGQAQEQHSSTDSLSQQPVMDEENKTDSDVSISNQTEDENAETQRKPLSEYNVNQSNNKQVSKQICSKPYQYSRYLPVVWMRNGKIVVDIERDREPEFV